MTISKCWLFLTVTASLSINVTEAFIGNIGESIAQGIKDLFWGAINGIKTLVLAFMAWVAASVQNFFQDTLKDILYAIESAGSALREHVGDTVGDLVGFQDDQDKITVLLLKLAEKGELPLRYYLDSLDLEIEFRLLDHSLKKVEIYGGALLAGMGIMILIWIGSSFILSGAEASVKEWSEYLDNEKKRKRKKQKKNKKKNKTGGQQKEIVIQIE